MKISVLIPCYNEEKLIRECVFSCLSQTRPPDEIVVVDDFSTDNSLKYLQQFGERIKLIRLDKKQGNKSLVQEQGLRYMTGDVFVAIDGDTIVSPQFIEKVEKAFQDKNTIAFAGYVCSTKYNWLTAVRQIDYVIGQKIHKKAQSLMNALYVIPGCAGAFRASYFRAFITFDHDTLTEDLDFTYKHHKHGLKIKYDDTAIVYTQDPHTLHSYVNQMKRWYAGGWQNLKKHASFFRNPLFTLELTLMYTEGLFLGIMMLLLPVISFKLFVLLFAYNLIVTFILVAFAAFNSKRLSLLFYFPHFILINYLNAVLYVSEFVKHFILRKARLEWFHPERRAYT